MDFSFQEDDATEEGGGIWIDGLHCTSDVHAIISEHLVAYLRRL